MARIAGEADLAQEEIPIALLIAQNPSNINFSRLHS
jgi:hypothetical protein